MEKDKIITNDFDDEYPKSRLTISQNNEDDRELTFGIDDVDDKLLDVGKIRDRTFNNELSEILANIRSNESKYDDDEIIIDEISEVELLKRFHELFYKAVNLYNLQNINTSINPYLFPDIFSEDSCEKNILLEMNRLFYPEFAILSYNPEKKCYSPDHFHINNLCENYIALYTSEELYTQILENKCGVIINQQDIIDNTSLKKRFTPTNEVQSQFLLYFVSFKNILSGIFDKMNLSARDDNHSNYLFQILMIVLKDGKEGDIIEAIYQKIRDNLLIHFLLLENKLLNKINELDYENPRVIYNIFVYIYQMLPNFSDAAGFVIVCKNNLYKENLLTLKYLLSKFQKNLPAESIILRITKDKLFILTQNSEVKTVELLVNEYNSIYKDSLMMRQSSGITNNNIVDLIHECLF